MIYWQFFKMNEIRTIILILFFCYGVLLYIHKVTLLDDIKCISASKRNHASAAVSRRNKWPTRYLIN